MVDMQEEEEGGKGREEKEEEFDSQTKEAETLCDDHRYREDYSSEDSRLQYLSYQRGSDLYGDGYMAFDPSLSMFPAIESYLKNSVGRARRAPSKPHPTHPPSSNNNDIPRNRNRPRPRRFGNSYARDYRGRGYSDPGAGRGTRNESSERGASKSTTTSVFF